jgi:beta-glucanase (GH16 family)
MPIAPRRRRLLAIAGVLIALTSALALAPSQAGGATAAPWCGPTMYKVNGVPWQCTFDDEFSGGSLDTNKWAVQQTALGGYTTGPAGSQACYVDRRSNVWVGTGYLHLTARRESAPFLCSWFVTRYTAGQVSGSGKFSQTYGRFEVRAKLPTTTIAGLQESFWLWPVDSTKFGAYPASGEIDFAEIYSLYSTLAVPAIHYTPAGLDPNVTSYKCTITGYSRFHTYAVEWTPTTITVIYDGQTCLVDTWKPAAPLVAPQPFNQPFFLALTQALGFGSNAFDPNATPLPATTQIDYARIWK